MENTQSVQQSQVTQGASKRNLNFPEGYEKTDLNGAVADSLSLDSVSSNESFDTRSDTSLQEELLSHQIANSSVSVKAVTLESIRDDLCVSDSDWSLITTRLDSHSDEKALKIHFFESKQNKRSRLGRFFMAPFDRSYARKMVKKRCLLILIGRLKK